MIVGLGKELIEVRKVISNEVNDIMICADVTDKINHKYYTLIRVHDRDKIKDILEIVYNEDGSCNLPKQLFYGIFVDVDTLNILLNYREPRKLFSYLKSDMRTEYDQHLIIQNFLLECLSLDVTYVMLNLFLEKDNINLDENRRVYFEGFIDFSKLDKNVSEENCTKKCSDIINAIISYDEDLSDNSNVKAIDLFRKKRRNNLYKTLIQLYNDFKIKEKTYRDRTGNIWTRLVEKGKNLYKEKLGKIMAYVGTVTIILSVILLISNLFNIRMPFSKYKGLNVIGTIDMMERQ